MIASEEITARYNKVEREADSLGRLIGVKRLRPSQQLKVQGMTPDLEGESQVVDEKTGAKVSIPNRATAMIAATVFEVDGNPIPFARSRADLDAMLDLLDTEGIEAAARAFARLTKGDSEQGGIEAAKN